MSTFMEHIHRSTDVPLFEPPDEMWAPVEFERDTPDMVDAYRHANGAITYIVHDYDGSNSNPRGDEGNVATLIQCNTSCIHLDDDVAGLRDAFDRFGTSVGMDRYLAMFRPDILHWDPEWYAGRDSYGWGYVTREAWEEAMFPPPPGEGATREQVEDYLEPTVTTTPEEAFDAEVKLFGQWAEGEVYGAVHVHPDGDTESVWGHLGYDDHKDIAAQMSESPITETLY